MNSEATPVKGDNELGRAVRKARLAIGYSLMKVAHILSEREEGEPIDAGYVSKIERGETKRPGKERLRFLAEILHLEPNELYRLADYAPELEPAGEMVRIPVGDISAGPGVWTEVFEYPLSKLPSRNIVAFIVHGTSMEPDIPEGSMVWADRDAQPRPGKLVVAWTEHGGVIKRLMHEKGKLYLKGNSTPPIEVTEDVRIEGVVFFMGHGV